MTPKGPGRSRGPLEKQDRIGLFVVLKGVGCLGPALRPLFQRLRRAVPESIKIICPRLHHLPALLQITRMIVRRPH